MNTSTGARVMAALLEAYGVTHIFKVPAVLRRTMVELEEHTDIKRLHVHSEKSAAYMADGYARATGRPGICMAQVIGALNIAAGLRDAYLAHSPVIAFTGGRDPSSKFRKVYQEVDDVPAFEPVTKFNATVDSAERFPDMVRQAFRVATSGCPGPVHLQFRGNEGQVDSEPCAFDDMAEELFKSVPAFRPSPELTAVRQALALLQEAKKPVIVAGGGVRASGAAMELVALAEKLAIPVVTSLNGKDTIPGTHPLSIGVVGTYSREAANQTVLESNLVCFIGTETGGMTTHFWQIPEVGVDAIQIDIEPENLGRNYPVKVAIQGDAKTTLKLMLENLDTDTAGQRDPWIERTTEIKRQWRDKFETLLTSDALPMRPERLCKELTDHLPEDAFVVVDTGHAGMWMGGMFDLRSNTQNYVRSAGHLGWAFPASLGVKCGLPDRPVICFTGDAGFWYHIGEIETAVRWNINAVILVNNNSSGNQSKRGFDRVYGGEQTDQARELWTFTRVNFARIAEEMGAVGIRVENPAELAGALHKAFSLNKPVVLDVVTDIDALAPIVEL